MNFATVLLSIPLFINLSLPFGFNSLFSPPQETVLSSHTISLNNRQADPVGNEVFKDNILLNMAYLRGMGTKQDLTWDEVRTPFAHVIRLYPGQTFAYHDQILPEYENRVVFTTNAHFNSSHGFRSVYGLYGNGVCHLASVMHWSASDAGLESNSPTRHDFATINEIPREYGVSIYRQGDGGRSSARQNLYITNNKENAVLFKFNYDGDNLTVAVVEEVSGKRQIF